MFNTNVHIFQSLSQNGNKEQYQIDSCICNYQDALDEKSNDFQDKKIACLINVTHLLNGKIA